MNRIAFHARCVVAAIAIVAISACNSNGTGSAVVPTAADSATVRFVLGAPQLETNFNGLVIPLGVTYLQLDGATFASSFPYGAVTQYGSIVTNRASEIDIYDSQGYRVGPLPLPPLQGGKRYSLVVVGSYPRYRVIAFAEPPPANGARIVAFGASSAHKHADFGTFPASQTSGFVRRGSVDYGATSIVSLGSRVTNLGAYVGKGTMPFPDVSTIALSALDTFDTASALPFNNAGTLTIFVLDPSVDGGTGPLVPSLDP